MNAASPTARLRLARPALSVALIEPSEKPSATGMSARIVAIPGLNPMYSK